MLEGLNPELTVLFRNHRIPCPLFDRVGPLIHSVVDFGVGNVGTQFGYLVPLVFYSRIQQTLHNIAGQEGWLVLFNEVLPFEIKKFIRRCLVK